MVSQTKTLHTVNVAFRLIDDFTGKLLKEPTFFFFADGKRLSPVRKPEGLFVLTDLVDLQNKKITICSPCYCDFTVSDLSCPDKKNPVMTVRLKPGVNYPLKNGDTAYSACFTGHNGNGVKGLAVELHAPYRNDTVKFKALQTMGQTCRISLTNPTGLDYTGLTFAIASDNKSDAPFVFKVLRRLDNTSYEIGEKPEIALSQALPAKRVFASETDASGRVLIPVVPDSEGGASIQEIELYASDGTSTCFRGITLVEGRISHFDETFEF
jgi:hypothetical protein